MKIRFVFVCEGSSDEGLLPHLERLCLDAGASEVEGTIPPLGLLSRGKTIEAQISAALELEPYANVIFIHRDADAPTDSERWQQIAQEIAALNVTLPWVAVVPVQELEAWLILDASAIRQVAENPNGSSTLQIPSPSHVHTISKPKEHLEMLLREACRYKGRRFDKFKSRFSHHRRLLLDMLDHQGPLHQVPSWQRLREDVRDIIARMIQENAT